MPLGTQGLILAEKLMHEEVRKHEVLTLADFLVHEFLSQDQPLGLREATFDSELGNEH